MEPNKYNLLLLALAFWGVIGAADAGEKEDLLLLRNTTIGLINELVKKGILTQKAADDMVQNAKAQADAEANQEPPQKQAAAPADPNDVRVTYVPQFVKDEIRQQVRTELREEVVGDVMQKAKSEKWGLPEALPEWVNRFKLSGDLRLRSQNDFMSEDNADSEDAQLLNFQAINQRGGRTGNFGDDFLNTTKDRHRFRQRFRLGVDAKINDNFQGGYPACPPVTNPIRCPPTSRWASPEASMNST